MAGESGGESATLETTPTWAVATVCFILIAVSILIEHVFGKEEEKISLQALNKIKSDLMLLGFISLLLTVLEKSIANICIPEGAAESFLPCKSLTSDEEDDSKCQEQGKASLMSRVAVQQLQMLIFFLAFFHVLSSFLTFSLATAKMKRWEHWEAETRTLEYQFSNVFHNYAWLPFIPLLMLLVVGTKLQSIITKMCLDSSDKSHVIRGALLVRPSDHFFWFDRPKLLLHLMHLISFQYKFGLRSCFHRETEDIVIRLAMGVVIPILCGYVTLPLYALVTQMGTSMGNSVFPERVVRGLKRWRAKARRNLARRNRNLALRSLDASVESSPSFATLDASPSLDIDYLSDDGAESVYEDNAAGKRPEQHQKLGSFEGFDPNRV
ncbi:UNVERIFIED_CONTAM: MLO-like protein 12 [Sesamum calycinum]|uniref:MLO-like protein 12 n=1 Tax=Sesamum calycinum TaxID=2727403 RepID=A0AAW2KLQ1_9LAMI